MKVIYLGASCRTGVSEKTGNRYNIAELTYAEPDENSVKNGADGRVLWNYIAHGLRVRALPLDPSNLSAFAKVQPLTEVELVLSPDPRRPQNNLVTGVR
jgi:hypothetical protein